MILDSLVNLEKYIGVIPHAGMIADFIRENDAAGMKAGRYDLEDGVFVNVCDCNNGDNSIYEAHRKYSDLQCVITGDEIMRRCHIASCTDGGEYSDENDCILYKKAMCESTLHLHAGEFALFEPEDAHCPGIAGETAEVRKLIFKIPAEVQKG